MQCLEIPIQLEQETETALLKTYFIEASDELYQSQKRPVILIMPGGAYRLTSDREAEPIALSLNAMGYHAAVLRYTTPAKFPIALRQVAKAFALLKDNAQQWNIDPEHILTMGFSAGGHLCASFSSYWNHPIVTDYLQRTDLCPFAQILCYPVIVSNTYEHVESIQNLLQDSFDSSTMKDMVSLEKQIHGQVPRTFLWHTYTDETVLVENSLCYAIALRKHKILCELHIYDKGEHGLSTAKKLSQRADGTKLQKECSTWMLLLENWLASLF